MKSNERKYKYGRVVESTCTSTIRTQTQRYFFLWSSSSSSMADNERNISFGFLFGFGIFPLNQSRFHRSRIRAVYSSIASALKHQWHTQTKSDAPLVALICLREQKKYKRISHFYSPIVQEYHPKVLAGPKHEHVLIEFDFGSRWWWQWMADSNQSKTLNATVRFAEAIIDLEDSRLQIAGTVNDFVTVHRKSSISFGQNAFHSQEEFSFNFDGLRCDHMLIW